MSRWIGHVIGALVVGLIGYTILMQYWEDSAATIANAAFLLFLLITAVVGWFLTWKRPRHPLGWLILAVPGLFVLPAPLGVLGGLVQPVAPEVAAWLDWVGKDREDTWVWLPPIGLLFTQIPLRFPTGGLPSKRWTWFSWFTIAAIVVVSAAFSTISPEVAPGLASPTYVAWDEDASLVLQLVCFGGLLGPAFIGSVASLFVRYRRADSVERAQLRWVFWGASIPVALLIVSWIVPDFSELLGGWLLLSYALIPMAFMVAILRYGLYGIDRIISRTVSYAIVTIVVVGLYVVIVLGIGAIVPDASSVGVALATLAAAGVFLPLLRWVQRWVDRRFNRAAYDAQKVVDAFGERLRNGADPHTAADDLVRAVEQTLQPTSVGVWTSKRAG